MQGVVSLVGKSSRYTPIGVGEFLDGGGQRSPCVPQASHVTDTVTFLSSLRLTASHVTGAPPGEWCGYYRNAAGTPPALSVNQSHQAAGREGIVGS